MNIQSIKTITWVATLAVGSTLGWSVYDFIERKPELKAGPSAEDLQALLTDVNEPPPPKDDLVDYDHVIKVFHEMNWTGKEPPPKPVPRDPTLAAEEPVTPVAELLRVLFVRAIPGDPENSVAFVEFVESSLVKSAKEFEDHLLRVGTRLRGKYTHVVVSSILPEGVEFSFDGKKERENELVGPVVFRNGGPEIVEVGPGGVIQPVKAPRISAGPNTSYWPKETTQVGPNEFYLGPESLEEMNENYSSILSRDVRTRLHHDPRTGKVDGIEITSVRDGSLPAGHGLSGGEVLKSINGHPVRSKSDAINFVKKEAERTDTWYAVFEKNGREYTRVYHSPDSD